MKIAYTGGGTLGSVIPLLGIHSYAAENEALWIGTQQGIEKEYIEATGITYVSIPSYKLRRYASVKTITEFPHLLQGYYSSKKILQKEKPDIVITAGGFTGVPVCWAANSLHIPYVVLQLDLLPGFANKLIAKKAAHIILSAKALEAKFKNANTTTCGIPLEKEFIAVATKKRPDSNLPTVLIVGGGTGSIWMNRFVKKFGGDILGLANIIHVQGLKDRSVTVSFGNTKGTYTSPPHPDRQEMARLYNASDIIVSRAGMGTFAEVSRLKKPSVIIPIPETHQEDNVEYFESRRSILVGDQEHEEHILRTITRLIQDTNLQRELAKNVADALPQTPEQCIINVISRIVHIPHGKK